MDLCKDQRVPPEAAARYAAQAGRYWDLFYRRNEARFFRDRHYFAAEFPQLLTVGSVLELGCGAGNSAFPLLELNPAARIYACDFAPSAVALVRAAPQYAAAAGRLTAFVADIIADDLTAHVPPASVEAATMIFVLSAITAEAQPLALRRVAATLRPGGQLLFRDYAAGDLAEARLGGEGRQQQVGPSCFVRWDGTLAYYFSQEGLRALFEGEGFRCEGASIIDRTVENRRQGARMERRFLQAVFTYVGRSEQGSGGGGSEEAGSCSQQGQQAQQRQQRRQQSEEPLEEVWLRLGAAELRLQCRTASQLSSAAASARGAAEALAALVLASPATFSNADVLELCSWDAPLAALAALRWCRRAVAAGAGEAAVRVLRRNALANSHLFVIERLRLQHLDWRRPQPGPAPACGTKSPAGLAAAAVAWQEQQMLRAVPQGFRAVLAALPSAAAGPAAYLQGVLSSAAALLSPRPGSWVLLCSCDASALAQARAVAPSVGLQSAPLPPELAAAAAAASAGAAPVHVLGLCHVPEA